MESPALVLEESVPFRVMVSPILFASSSLSNIIASSKLPMSISIALSLRCVVSENITSRVEASIGE